MLTICTCTAAGPARICGQVVPQPAQRPTDLRNCISSKVYIEMKILVALKY